LEVKFLFGHVSLICSRSKSWLQAVAQIMDRKSSVNAEQDFVVTTSIPFPKAMAMQDEAAIMTTRAELEPSTVQQISTAGEVNANPTPKSSLRRHATRLANAVEPHTAQVSRADVMVSQSHSGLLEH
jgi:hypothetical protein